MKKNGKRRQGPGKGRKGSRKGATGKKRRNRRQRLSGRKRGNRRQRLSERKRGGRRERKPSRQIKDRLFRFLFEKDREALLSLYNALNGTDYRDAAALQVVTIESAVYIVMKNDLAFVLAGVLNLYEHQSTRNPNLPVRFLIYLAKEYQKLIEEVDQSLYGTARITLPTPQCVVFYNGEKDAPEEEYLRLSDAFENRERQGDVELQVRVLNVNRGHNRELMEKCRILREYAEFVALTREYAAETGDRKTALNRAIDESIKRNVLGEFLRRYRAEVLGMLLEEFDAKKYERTIRAEGREEGRAEGIEIGREEGIMIGKVKGIEIGAYQKLILQADRKKSKGIPAEEAAAMLEEDPILMEKIYHALDTLDGEKDWEKIYHALETLDKAQFVEILRNE